MEGRSQRTPATKVAARTNAGLIALASSVAVTDWPFAAALHDAKRCRWLADLAEDIWIANESEGRNEKQPWINGKIG